MFGGTSPFAFGSASSASRKSCESSSKERCKISLLFFFFQHLVPHPHQTRPPRLQQDFSLVQQQHRRLELQHHQHWMQHSRLVHRPPIQQQQHRRLHNRSLSARVYKILRPFVRSVRRQLSVQHQHQRHLLQEQPVHENRSFDAMTKEWLIFRLRWGISVRWHNDNSSSSTTHVYLRFYRFTVWRHVSHIYTIHVWGSCYTESTGNNGQIRTCLGSR